MNTQHEKDHNLKVASFILYILVQSTVNLSQRANNLSLQNLRVCFLFLKENEQLIQRFPL